MIQEFVGHFTYVGIFLLLLAASLGVPIPEEIAIVAAAVLSHENLARWWIALPVCIFGVLSGDVVLYWSGRYWGERLLNWRMVRLVLNPEREERFKTAYRRHAGKTIFTVRHVTDQLEEVMADVHRVQRWLGLLAIVAITMTLAVNIWRRNRRGVMEEP